MAEAQILCTKCGNASAEPTLECAKCHGRNARVCGGCGTQNSIAKNFCDHCGHSIVDLGQVAPPPKTSLPGAPGADIPATVIKRLPSDPAPAPGSPFPEAKKLSGGPVGGAPAAGSGTPASPYDDLWSAPAAKPPVSVEPDDEPSDTARRVKIAINALAAAIGIAAAAYGVWTYYVSRKPEVLVPKMAADYLEALRLRNFETAYAMFSDAAKRACTDDEFKASRTEAPWTWSGLRIDYQEPGAILLSYDLHPTGAPPRQDHLLFTLENDRWTRPYNWTLMRQVEAAFDKGDADSGLLLAQTAATINPRDPMAWGYLCEAAYYRKSPTDAVLRCEKALDLARTYPSNLTLKSVYHLHAILADTYHHSLRKIDRALDQYGQMLSFPDISPADQCQILLARAQAYTEMSRPGEALADLDRSAQLCETRQDQEFIARMRSTLRAPDAQ